MRATLFGERTEGGLCLFRLRGPAEVESSAAPPAGGTKAGLSAQSIGLRFVPATAGGGAYCGPRADCHRGGSFRVRVRARVRVRVQVRVRVRDGSVIRRRIRSLVVRFVRALVVAETVGALIPAEEAGTTHVVFVVATALI